MSAPEPGWLADMRSTLDDRTGNVIEQVNRYHQAWGSDNARRLLDLADRMADALVAITSGGTNHRPIPFSPICDTCSRLWPCPAHQAAKALRSWRDATRTET